jgi:hypothetical protein
VTASAPGTGFGARSRAAWLAAAATALLSLALTLPGEVLGRGEQPPAPVDGRDYDHLALNLARGRGFAYCWSDPEWRAPYERAANSRDYALHLDLHGPCFRTARRAPGHPVALAAAYVVWGRSFLAGRWVGALALALAGALGAFLAVRVAGLVAGSLFAVGFLLDEPLRFLVGAYMSEPLSALAVLAVLAAHVSLFRDPKRSTALSAGATLGALMLVRHHFSLLFGLGLLGAGLAFLRGPEPRRLAAAYAGAALLLFAPWGLRNSLVLGAPMPLGTQGGHGLAASYGGDGAEDDDGTWNSDQTARLWARVKGKPPDYAFADLARELRGSLEVERELSVVGQQAAGRWLRRHWRQLPRVALLRLRAHARGYGALGLAAVACGLIALGFGETRGAALPGLAILATTAATVAITYEEARGRYAAPVRPIAYVVGAIGAAAAVSRLRGVVPVDTRRVA